MDQEGSGTLLSPKQVSRMHTQDFDLESEAIFLRKTFAK